MPVSEFRLCSNVDILTAKFNHDRMAASQHLTHETVGNLN